MLSTDSTQPLRKSGGLPLRVMVSDPPLRPAHALLPSVPSWTLSSLLFTPAAPHTSPSPSVSQRAAPVSQSRTRPAGQPPAAPSAAAAEPPADPPGVQGQNSVSSSCRRVSHNRAPPSMSNGMRTHQGSSGLSRTPCIPLSFTKGVPFGMPGALGPLVTRSQ